MHGVDSSNGFFVDAPREREFLKALPQKWHSQGIRKKAIHLPGQVTVSLSVTYCHRCQSGGNGRRGLFPMLMLLDIEGHYTPNMKQRMAKAAKLNGLTRKF